jgi:pumilio RNA-binding family
MDPDLLRFPETAAHVARLLLEGDEQARRSVLVRVRSDVLSVTGTSERQAVFLSLVRACAGRPDELQHIIQALYKGNGFLMGVAKHNYGYVPLLGK